MENKNAASVPMKIGIASLDAQHEALFECINKFIRLYLKGEPERGEVEKQFAALVDYTVTHFDDEEFFMRSIDYPELANHAAQHQALRDVVDSFSTRLETEKDLHTFCGEVIELLKTWLNKHICTLDAKIAVYYQSHGK